MHICVQRLTRLVLLSILCFWLFDCDDDGVNLRQESMLGQWQLVEQKISPGGPAKWVDVDDGAIFTFLENGSFTISEDPHCTSGSYIASAETLTLNFNCPEYNIPFDFFMVEISTTSFTISPRTVTCVEECLSKYKKIN